LISIIALLYAHLDNTVPTTRNTTPIRTAIGVDTISIIAPFVRLENLVPAFTARRPIQNTLYANGSICTSVLAFIDHAVINDWVQDVTHKKRRLISEEPRLRHERLAILEARGYANRPDMSADSTRDRELFPGDRTSIDMGAHKDRLSKVTRIVNARALKGAVFAPIHKKRRCRVSITVYDHSDVMPSIVSDLTVRPTVLFPLSHDDVAAGTQCNPWAARRPEPISRRDGVRRLQPSFQRVLRLFTQHFSDRIMGVYNILTIKIETRAFCLARLGTAIATLRIPVITLFDRLFLSIATQPTQAINNPQFSPLDSAHVLLAVTLWCDAIIQNLERPETNRVHIGFSAPRRNECRIKIHSIAEVHLANLTAKRRLGDPCRQRTNPKMTNIESMGQITTRIHFVGQRPIQIETTSVSVRHGRNVYPATNWKDRVRPLAIPTGIEENASIIMTNLETKNGGVYAVPHNDRPEFFWVISMPIDPCVEGNITEIKEIIGATDRYIVIHPVKAQGIADCAIRLTPISIDDIPIIAVFNTGVDNVVSTPSGNTPW